jgi:hypothetical protein
VADLREQGHSLRAIAGAVGVGEATIRRDLEIAPPDAIPDRVIRQGGGTYPAHREPLPAWQNIHQSKSNEWYTPPEYIASVRAVMGGIDVDPASNLSANEIIGAAVYYTTETDGLASDWPGRVYLNPPWGGRQAEFISRLLDQFSRGITEQALVLVNAHATETTWFAPLWDHTLCFTNHRINFYGGDGSGSTHGSVFVYLGDQADVFVREFDKWGFVVKRVRA